MLVYKTPQFCVYVFIAIISRNLLIMFANQTHKFCSSQESFWLSFFFFFTMCADFFIWSEFWAETGTVVGWWLANGDVAVKSSMFWVQQLGNCVKYHPAIHGISRSLEPSFHFKLFRLIATKDLQTISWSVLIKRICVTTLITWIFSVAATLSSTCQLSRPTVVRLNTYFVLWTYRPQTASTKPSTLEGCNVMTPDDGRWRRRRPKKTWRRTFQEDLTRANISWEEVEHTVMDRPLWRQAAAQCTYWHQRN